MPYKHSKRGWYKLSHPEKFIKPIDTTMESTRITESGLCIEYKSSLERKAFAYADINPKVKYFSIEPFAIKYIKPTDNKVHRYYIDLFIEFVNGSKFMVEVKSFAETQMPRGNAKSGAHLKQLETFLINQAKWRAATKFASQKGIKFIILTENELGL